MPVADGATNFPTYVIQVNDVSFRCPFIKSILLPLRFQTAPIWAYCRQAAHCGQGMVFSVNAVETGANNFDAFKAKAIQLNGTASATSTSTSAKPTNGAIGSRSAGAALALVGAVAGLLL